MRKMALIGGTGGVGNSVVDYLRMVYNVTQLSSSDIDVASRSSTREAELGHYDIVVDAAGVNHSGVAHKPNPELWRQIEVNAVGFTNILSACLPGMRERGYGRVIYLSSVLSRHTVRGTSIYSGTKAYAEAVARVSGVENVRKGVTVNTIRMGYFNYGMISQVPENMIDDIIASVPAGRLGEPEDLFTAIQFLVDSPFVTGSTLDLTGGL